MMQLMRFSVVIVFGMIPAGIFFWWLLHGCMFQSFPQTSAPFAPAEWRPLWNITLFCLFGAVHSALAEFGINRLAYTVIAGVTSLSVIWLWQPMEGMLWQFGDDRVAWWFGTVQFVVWLIGHLWIINEMGLSSFLGFSELEKQLVTSGPYAWCRHPMHFNILASLLMTPCMSADRLTMLLAVSLYLVVAIPMEEARLCEQYGLDWQRYKKRTAMLIPGVL